MFPFTRYRVCLISTFNFRGARELITERVSYRFRVEARWLRLEPDARHRCAF